MGEGRLGRGGKLTLVGVFIGLFLAALDQTVVATALPRILEEIGGQAWYGWVGATYLLGSTLSAPIAGRLVEIVPRRAVLLGSLFLFGVGSALCGLSSTFLELVLYRLVQGIGGGALFSLAFTTLAWFFPPRERSRWAGLIGAIFGVASAVGPPIGGYLAYYLSWRWAFWGNLPFLFAAFGFVWRFLPGHAPAERGSFDGVGAILLAGWTVPFLLAFSFWGPERLGDPLWGTVLFMVGVIFLGIWVRHELRVRSPLFELRLVQVSTFRHAAIAGFFFGPVFLGGVTFFPLYLQSVLGYTPSESGFLLLAFTVGAVLSTGGVGAWVSRHGRYKPILLVGALFLFAFLILAAVALPRFISVYVLLLVMIGAAISLGPFQALLSVVGQNDIPPARIGSVTSAIQFMRQVGSTVGLAILNLLYLNGGGVKMSIWTGLRWVFGGAALMALFLFVTVWLMPDGRLRQRHPIEVE
ncbi:MAG: MFS transporter [Bacteroidia bacterium]|nr:MFS transporter [Bacteroidia bacterium]